MMDGGSRPSPYRLGFAVKVLGGGGLATADTRRWQSGPHLRRSLQLLESVWDHLEAIDVRVYRLSSQVVPYGTHPDLPALAWERQLEEAAPELEAAARRTRALGLRLSTHPGQYTVLNAPEPGVFAKAARDLEQDAALLDALGQGPEGSVVVHVGGEYGDRAAALDRWERAWWGLSDRARARLALENDERIFGVEDVLELHRRTGVRVVLDVHHHRIHPASGGIPLGDALGRAIDTWAGARPKVHLSSARTMLDNPIPVGVPQPRTSRSRKPAWAPGFPQLRGHADLVAPWDLEALVAAADAPLDVMLEAKAKDLALLHLRRSLREIGSPAAGAEEVMRR